MVIDVKIILSPDTGCVHHVLSAVVYTKQQLSALHVFADNPAAATRKGIGVSVVSILATQPFGNSTSAAKVIVQPFVFGNEIKGGRPRHSTRVIDRTVLTDITMG